MAQELVFYTKPTEIVAYGPAMKAESYRRINPMEKRPAFDAYWQRAATAKHCERRRRGGGPNSARRVPISIPWVLRSERSRGRG